MKKSILPLILALLLGAGSASAQSVPHGTALYVVGTTEEVYRIWAAMYSEWRDTTAPWAPEVYEHAPWQHNPYYNSDGMLIREGTPEINCLTVNAARFSELGATQWVDVDPTAGTDFVEVTVPELEDLQTWFEVPWECRDAWLEANCGPSPRSESMLCGFGVTYCCEG